MTKDSTRCKTRLADHTVLAASALALFLGINAVAAPGNLVIYRIGDGSSGLTNATTSVFLDEYTQTGTLVRTIALPTAAIGANRALTGQGTSTAEGLLSLSPDGTILSLMGYDAAPGVANPAGTTAAAVNRVVGLVDVAGNINTSTALTDAASSGNPRAATTSNGTDIWVSGSTGGVRYTTLGATTSTQLSTTVVNLRGLNIFEGQLYVSTASGSAVRIGTVGTGLPTTSGQTITSLPGFPMTGTEPYGFAFFDLDAGVVGPDTLYIADDGTVDSLAKFSLVNGSWLSNGTIAITAPRGITGIAMGSTVNLFATAAGTLSSVTDTSGYNGTFTGTLSTLASAPTNTAFRGLALAPIPEPATVTTLLGGAVLLGLICRRPRAAFSSRK